MQNCFYVIVCIIAQSPSPVDTNVRLFLHDRVINWYLPIETSGRLYQRDRVFGVPVIVVSMSM